MRRWTSWWPTALAGTLAIVLWTVIISTLWQPSRAQQSNPTIPPNGISCAYNAALPTITTGNSGWVQCDANGRILTSSSGGAISAGPYPFTPLTPGQHNLAIVSSTALTIPTGATYATICAATAQVKYTTDGTTTPTASVGMTLSSGSCVAESGGTVLSNFKAISATGTLDVEYFK